MLLAGAAAYVGTRVVGGSSPPRSAPSAATVPLDPQAAAVAREFVATAVARRNLVSAWTLAAPQLRRGMTLAEWKTGTIPVQPYPVAQATASYAVQSSQRAAAVLQVTFAPHPMSTAQPGSYLITLEQVEGRWLVAGWTPRSLLGAHG